MYNMKIFKSVVLCVSSLLLLTSCQSTPSKPIYDSSIGEEIYKACVSTKPEFCVIKIRSELEKNKDANEAIKSGFLSAGGDEKHWELYSQAAVNLEFDAGMKNASRLQAGTILDVDIVEYINGSLKNSSNVKKLAFSSGFISGFNDPEGALHHFYTLWVWAMPNER